MKRMRKIERERKTLTDREGCKTWVKSKPYEKWTEQCIEWRPHFKLYVDFARTDCVLLSRQFFSSLFYSSDCCCSYSDSPQMQMNMHNSYWRTCTHISYIIYPSLRFFSFWSTFWSIATAIANSFQYLSHTLTHTHIHIHTHFLSLSYVKFEDVCSYWYLLCAAFAITQIVLAGMNSGTALQVLTRNTFTQYVWKLHLVLESNCILWNFIGYFPSAHSCVGYTERYFGVQPRRLAVQFIYYLDITHIRILYTNN